MCQGLVFPLSVQSRRKPRNRISNPSTKTPSLSFSGKVCFTSLYPGPTFLLGLFPSPFPSWAAAGPVPQPSASLPPRWAVPGRSARARRARAPHASSRERASALSPPLPRSFSLSLPEFFPAGALFRRHRPPLPAPPLRACRQGAERARLPSLSPARPARFGKGANPLFSLPPFLFFRPPADVTRPHRLVRLRRSPPCALEPPLRAPKPTSSNRLPSPLNPLCQPPFPPPSRARSTPPRCHRRPRRPRTPRRTPAPSSLFPAVGAAPSRTTPAPSPPSPVSSSCRGNFPFPPFRLLFSPRSRTLGAPYIPPGAAVVPPSFSLAPSPCGHARRRVAPLSAAAASSLFNPHRRTDSTSSRPAADARRPANPPQVRRSSPHVVGRPMRPPSAPPPPLRPTWSPRGRHVCLPRPQETGQTPDPSAGPHRQVGLGLPSSAQSAIGPLSPRIGRSAHSAARPSASRHRLPAHRPLGHRPIPSCAPIGHGPTPSGRRPIISAAPILFHWAALSRPK